MSTKRSAGWQRIVRNEEGFAYCKAGCGKVCPTRRRLYCSNECWEDYAVRNFPALARERVFERDHGVCALCGVDTVALERRWEKAKHDEKDFAYGRRTPGPDDELVDWRKERAAFSTAAYGHLWEMDHIVPVVEGGGQCGMDGLRTLCYPCHRRVTNDLRARLAAPSKEARLLEWQQREQTRLAKEQEKAAAFARLQPVLFPTEASDIG